MIQLGKLKGITKVLTVDFGNDLSLELEYSPAMMGDEESSAYCDAITQAKNRNEAVGILSEFFPRLIVWWDLYDGEKPVELKPEVLKTLPPFVLLTVLKAISTNELGGDVVGKSADV